MPGGSVNGLDELHMALVSPICAVYNPTEERVTNRGKQIPRVAGKEES